MSNQISDVDAITVADLEYDIGGKAALEPGDAEGSNEVVIVYFVPPR